MKEKYGKVLIWWLKEDHCDLHFFVRLESCALDWCDHYWNVNLGRKQKSQMSLEIFQLYISLLVNIPSYGFP